MVILTNPDHPSLENISITSSHAETVYRNSLKKQKCKDHHKEKLQYEEEVSGFMSVFDSLKDFEEGKSLYYGGKLTFEGQEMTDTSILASDFTTLLRNGILYKLVGNLGLKVKQVLSSNGKNIFLLITADEEDLELEAENIRFSKQLEIALSDLISLFPCDKFYRPLHLTNFPNEILKASYKKIRKFMRIAFKTDKEIEKSAFKYDPEGVSVVQ